MKVFYSHRDRLSLFSSFLPECNLPPPSPRCFMARSLRRSDLAKKCQPTCDGERLLLGCNFPPHPLFSAPPCPPPQPEGADIARWREKKTNTLEVTGCESPPAFFFTRLIQYFQARVSSAADKRRDRIFGDIVREKGEGDGGWDGRAKKNYLEKLLLSSSASSTLVLKSGGGLMDPGFSTPPPSLCGEGSLLPFSPPLFSSSSNLAMFPNNFPRLVLPLPPSPPPPFSPPLSFKSCWLRWNNFQACWPEKRRKWRRRLSRKTRKNARGGEKGCREYPDPTAQHNDMFTP